MYKCGRITTTTTTHEKQRHTRKINKLEYIKHNNSNTQYKLTRVCVCVCFCSTVFVVCLVHRWRKNIYRRKYKRTIRKVAKNRVETHMDSLSFIVIVFFSHVAIFYLSIPRKTHTRFFFHSFISYRGVSSGIGIAAVSESV